MTKDKLKEEVKKIAKMDNVDLIKYQSMLSMSNLDIKAWKFLIRAVELRFKEITKDIDNALCQDSHDICDDHSDSIIMGE